MKISDNQLEFARFVGDMAESIGFNRSIGQIFGLLYLSPQPVSLSDIATSLSMSKGNASINLRILENWGAVFPVSVQGSRRDHYKANTDLKSLATRRLQEGLGKRLQLAEDRLQLLPDSPEMNDKIKQIKKYIQSGQKALNLLPKVTKFIDL